MMQTFLGIDVASKSWADIGSALITVEDQEQAFLAVQPGAIAWPSKALSAQALADAVDDYVRTHGVVAVALDGPQGWRDPSTRPDEPGVGRRCERECRTQGKTGTFPMTFPRNQRPWIEFSIALFDALLAKPGVMLATHDSKPPQAGAGYLLLECFPTSAWRSSGLKPLPGKARFDLSPYIHALVRGYGLPPFTTSSHDDLQAVVAALTAVGAVGGPVVGVPRGVPETYVTETDGTRRRLEGLIWDARSTRTPTGAVDAIASTAPVADPGTPTGTPTFYVTREVLEQVSRTGDPRQAQITFRGFQGATKATRRRVTIDLDGASYTLVVGDAHSIWPSHQDEGTAEAFELLFARLADDPDKPLRGTVA